MYIIVAVECSYIIMVIERNNELELNFDSSAFTFGEEHPVSIEDFMLFEA